MNELFRKLAHLVSEATGSPGAFLAAASIILIWAITELARLRGEFQRLGLAAEALKQVEGA